MIVPDHCWSVNRFLPPGSTLYFCHVASAKPRRTRRTSSWRMSDFKIPIESTSAENIYSSGSYGPSSQRAIPPSSRQHPASAKLFPRRHAQISPIPNSTSLRRASESISFDGCCKPGKPVVITGVQGLRPRFSNQANNGQRVSTESEGRGDD